MKRHGIPTAHVGVFEDAEQGGGVAMSWADAPL